MQEPKATRQLISTPTGGPGWPCENREKDLPRMTRDDHLDVGVAAIELIALGVAALVMSSVTGSLWVWTCKHNVVELRS